MYKRQVYDVKAQSAYVVNTDTNIIVYEKDSQKQVSAGGLTKYMTIALLLTNYADQLDNTFQMPFAISDYVHGTDNADMRSNETFTYREAIYAMVTRNANEAAMLSLIHISEPTRRTPISYAVFCLKKKKKKTHIPIKMLNVQRRES